MKKPLQILSLLALLGVIVPPVLYLTGMLEKPPMKTAMFASTLLWFATAPFWMGKGNEEEAS